MIINYLQIRLNFSEYIKQIIKSAISTKIKPHSLMKTI